MSKLKTANLPEELRKILSFLFRNYSEDEISKVVEAYEFAEFHHHDQRRVDGEAFITHPLNVALMLAELNLDIVTIEAGLLHDVAEDTSASLEDIEKIFGIEVAKIVDGVTKIEKLKITDSKLDEKIETIIKLFLAMAKDLRVILVKLADRLHNMRTISSMPPEKQIEKAKETIQIYAPIAHRLGIHNLKWQLEDLAFKYLYPQDYEKVSELVDKKRADRELIAEEYKSLLQLTIARQGINFKITGREKHFFSIWKKMNMKIKSIEEIYDLIALRVITENEKDCYYVLGIVHNLWNPIPGRVKDYIATPKANGYRSLHTTVITHRGEPLEIQIRSREMHQEAEYGLAAHWLYKEGKVSKYQQNWLKKLEEWHEDYIQGIRGFNEFQNELQLEEVYVFSPKGELKHMPKGSTTIDFAYSVHTEVGHHYAGAKVNGRIVPVNYELQNGDVIEIIVNKNSPGPSMDWSKYAKSSSARGKIRKFFREKFAPEIIEKGKDLLRKVSKRLQVSIDELLQSEKIYKIFPKDEVSTESDLLFRYGESGLSVEEIINIINPSEEKESAVEIIPAKVPKKYVGSGTVLINGESGIEVKMAKCCCPVPGDAIKGILSKRGITVHSSDCPNANEISDGTLVLAEWGNTEKEFYPAYIIIESEDSSMNVTKEISQKAKERNIKIQEINTRFGDWDSIIYKIKLLVNSSRQLGEIMENFEKTSGISRVYRVRENK